MDWQIGSVLTLEARDVFLCRFLPYVILERVTKFLANQVTNSDDICKKRQGRIIPAVLPYISPGNLSSKKVDSRVSQSPFTELLCIH